VPVRPLLLRGVTYYDASKALSAGRLVQGAALKLVHEPQNLFDKNAVVVLLSPSNEKLGYLSKKIAPAYQSALLAGRVTSARVREVSYRNRSTGPALLRVEISVTLAIQPEARPSKNEPQDIGIASSLTGDLPTEGGVYRLTNQVQSRTYIGSSANIRRRIQQHFRDLIHGTHFNPHLQSDFASQSGRGFAAYAVELVASVERLPEAEERAIRAALRRRQRLYNMTSDGQGRAGAAASMVDTAPPISDWKRRGQPPIPETRASNRTVHKGPWSNSSQAAGGRERTEIQAFGEHAGSASNVSPSAWTGRTESAELLYARGTAAAANEDYANAIRLWREAAGLRHTKAAYNLGVAYAQGKGVRLDLAEARNWWRIAAEWGHATATTKLLSITSFQSTNVRQSPDSQSVFDIAKAWWRSLVGR
jgi:hypothetical protein